MEEKTKPQARTLDLGKGSIPKLLAQLAIPAVVAQIVNLLYNIVDRIYIGHIPGIGAAALTGVGLFAPLLMLINAFAMLSGSGGAPFLHHGFFVCLVRVIQRFRMQLSMHEFIFLEVFLC